MWVGNEVVVGVNLGVRGRERGDATNMLFGGVYTVYGIRSLLQ